ncbi:50S ribosomal protein L33 [Bacillus sp. HMF5848]|nr:50S ribosomal protein L33 [Bacillus sp. HMF5848]RSK25531.1 50S ribosomal protein L33 [Bacillus sp. HMF5848]
MALKIVLSCQDCGSRNYTTSKSFDVRDERLQTKKYCKVCKAHTVHKESK